MPFTPQQWNAVTDLFTRSFASSLYVSFGTVNPDGSPHVTPIGSLVLLDNGTGVFFDGYLGHTERNVRHNPRISVLAVDTAKHRWLRALATGRFPVLPGIRLVGVVGPRRLATPEEQDRFRRRVRWLRRFKGHDLLWKDLRFVHDVTFEAARPIRAGVMTKGLWPGTADDRATT
jgi:uncharacterized protein